MEEHRLKPMKQGYDEQLFYDLYQATNNLRKKLASEIDPKRFGVDYKEILSWFDIKFIYTFNKYFGEKEPNLLKAHLIRALQFFKNRILRAAYTNKNQVNNNTIDIEELYDLQEPTIEYEYDEREFFMKLALEFMHNNLSEEAYRVLEVELHPPLYILTRLEDKESTAKIPSNLIADYLGWGLGKDAIKQVNSLRREIKNITMVAKEHFSELQLV
jgi:hypothetical protein